jgi:O-methyltransferase involved in polyketide biosynthesis
MRAAHQLLDPPPRILDDPTASPCSGPAREQMIRDSAALRKRLKSSPARAHGLAIALCRRPLAAAVGRGVTQYVILGAGLDTFAVRQPAWARKLRILEVDHAGTQELKRSHLAAAGLTVPPNAGFATIDFERESVREGLLRHANLADAAHVLLLARRHHVSARRRHRCRAALGRRVSVEAARSC